MLFEENALAITSSLVTSGRVEKNAVNKAKIGVRRRLLIAVK
ncbi:hypothetical protein FLAVO9R_70237 [Flavobacterium sp. 9R]|nr:hypothetical protein FLAVO9R_70237 [Flavobacterium sp. 9R]